MTANASAFTSSNPPAPEGDQAAFISKQGTISQTFNVADDAVGAYSLSFQTAQRGIYQPGGYHDFAVDLDGVEVARFRPKSSSYESQSLNLNLSSGSHILTFRGINSAGGGNTSFIDNVSLNQIAETQFSLSNGGFETPEAGPNGASGSYLYRPTDTAWSFVNPSGVTANASAFTSSNPPAPEGDQAAFISKQGTISQTFNVADDAVGCLLPLLPDRPTRDLSARRLP